MGRRTNTAIWLEKQQRWQIKVQKNGERKAFVQLHRAEQGREKQIEKRMHGWTRAWLTHGFS